jgi:hypothetical protein
MEITPASLSATLSSNEFSQLRQALEMQYPDSKNIPGSQLGLFIRRKLTNPDLKGRFGGLKNFIVQYFPAEISWQGRKGLDDLYDISFSKDTSGQSSHGWKPVPPEASGWLWSAVTNPSINLKFAWLAKDRSLMQAPSPVPLTEGLAVVEKLTRADYRDIATAFVRSMKDTDTSRYLQAIENSSSSVEFTMLVRDQGLLPAWEAFRVDSAVQLFSDHLKTSGANLQEATRWASLLRASQQAARTQRIKKAAAIVPARRPAERLPLLDHQTTPDQVPSVLAVAIKAMEYLSDAELSDLRLPLGSTMRAFTALLKGHQR